jgi:hypothetical protein
MVCYAQHFSEPHAGRAVGVPPAWQWPPIMQLASGRLLLCCVTSVTWLALPRGFSEPRVPAPWLPGGRWPGRLVRFLSVLTWWICRTGGVPSEGGFCFLAIVHAYTVFSVSRHDPHP